jgi:uncharacterized protein YhjY with autotransporter beta-barrel domain
VVVYCVAEYRNAFLYTCPQWSDQLTDIDNSDQRASTTHMYPLQNEEFADVITIVARLLNQVILIAKSVCKL